MRIAVFGGTFVDVFVYGNEPHKSEILELPGGSGLNIALGLFKLGYRVDFFSNIGNDLRKEFIFTALNRHNFDTSNMRIQNANTAFHISWNGKPIGVDRGANKIPIDTKEIDFSSYDLVVINTEIPFDSVKEICKLSTGKIFIDIGPRNRIELEDIKMDKGDKILIVGNERECKNRSCDVIKQGAFGANWGDTKCDGNREKYISAIGTGDSFDIVLIDGFIRGLERKATLERAVSVSQELARNVKGAFNKVIAIPSLLDK